MSINNNCAIAGPNFWLLLKLQQDANVRIFASNTIVDDSMVSFFVCTRLYAGNPISKSKSLLLRFYGTSAILHWLGANDAVQVGFTDRCVASV